MIGHPPAGGGGRGGLSLWGGRGGGYSRGGQNRGLGKSVERGGVRVSYIRVLLTFSKVEMETCRHTKNFNSKLKISG